MKKKQIKLIDIFNSTILTHPKLTILIILCVVAFLGYKTKDFKLDASSETLVMENDTDLAYARTIYKRYGQNDYLVVTYQPKNKDLLAPEVLKKLASLSKELKTIDRVESIFSILNAPLIESPPVPVSELAKNVKNILSPSVDKVLAKKELLNSPLYKDLLTSRDFKTTALIINLKKDTIYAKLLEKRNKLKDKLREKGLDEAEKTELQDVETQFSAHRDKMRKITHEDIKKIRVIISKYDDDAQLFLGGVSMIADDMINYIKSDLKIFGTGVLLFLVITLGIIFKKLQWIILPVLCCSFSAISMTGLLGIFGWEVTVISSNFISLQLIITMALNIHLIVRYRELLSENPDASQKELVSDTIKFMIKPCLYTSLTTIAGFGSLILCDILPVINFGLMMSAGILVSLVMTFLLFPAIVVLMPKGSAPSLKGKKYSFTESLGLFTGARVKSILVLSILGLAVGIAGISKLTVENSFIDYFKKNTEIYQGMKVIDQKLGGTTPFDVLIDFDKLTNSEKISGLKDGDAEEDFDSEFNDFGDFEEKEVDPEKYWFTSDKMKKIKDIDDYLDSLPETGKVVSLATMLKIAEKFNDGKPLDNLSLALLYSEIPESFKKMIINPYVSVENSQARFSVRVKDSEPGLKRDLFLKKIKADLIKKFGIKSDRIRISGMLVLYNNMLQNLFRSQILTFGSVVAALFIMFLILFRSVRIALIALFPNLLSIGMVLGFMGWVNIPLDMMTITIAAISVGIAVDNTIHYIHRFRFEFPLSGKYFDTMMKCHGSIGYAMYYTSVTVIIGFSILVLSNFIPSIYFGLLTSLAMLIALIGALTLLPAMIVFFKPLGPER